MKLNMLLFGVTKEIIGTSQYEFEFEGKSVSDLKTHLFNKYPRLTGLNSIVIAVNNEYAADSLVLKSTDEIALIPPVSGG